LLTGSALSRWPFFSGLSDAVLDRLALLGSEAVFEAGAVVFRAGEPAAALYLVVEGWVDIVASEAESHHLLTAVTAGDVFGWSALVEPFVYTASARCATPVRALVFPAVEMRSLLESDAALCFTLMGRLCRVIAGRLQAARSQLVSTYAVSTQHRMVTTPKS
jgi:CRP-like cAMP-binding protein